MRIAIAPWVLGVSSLALSSLAPPAARADVSIAAPARPTSPLGVRCDAALARAQGRFEESSNQVRFHVRERTLTGEYEWSDMCGVWGRYTITLAPDDRPAQPWRWQERVRPDDEHNTPVRIDATRRASGWRASFHVRGDDVSGIGRRFIDAFQPALDACLAAPPPAPVASPLPASE